MCLSVIAVKIECNICRIPYSNQTNALWLNNAQLKLEPCQYDWITVLIEHGVFVTRVTCDKNVNSCLTAISATNLDFPITPLTQISVLSTADVWDTTWTTELTARGQSPSQFEDNT